jgi:4-alpha-glucanotransferase
MHSLSALGNARLGPCIISSERTRPSFKTCAKPQRMSSPRLPQTPARPQTMVTPETSTQAVLWGLFGGDDGGIGKPLPADYDTHFSKKSTNRRAGVLVHPTSLPGYYGIGELGWASRDFVDWMFDAGMQVWQLLPLVPPDPMYYSPYSGTDGNCGNPLLISIDALIDEGLLDTSDAPPKVPVGPADFATVDAVKTPIIKKAVQRLMSDPKFAGLKAEVAAFRAENAWVEESAVFDACRQQPELSVLCWWEWPEGLRLRQEDVLSEFKITHKALIDEFITTQYLFEMQWKTLRAYAKSKGISIIGDMPIYVGGHSADVWANQKLFELDNKGVPTLVSGVPPDAFTAVLTEMICFNSISHGL